MNPAACAGWMIIQYCDSLPDADAQALGRLILSRRWQRVADRLVQLAREGRHDVKPALSECRTMVGILWQFFLGLSPGSATEKWAVLEQLAVDLYPNGRMTLDCGTGREDRTPT